MPTLDFKGKQFVYSHHLSVPFRGEHLKGNDDTVYKRKLFELLTEHASTAVQAGEMTIEAATGGMRFKMLMENSWQQELIPELA